MAKKKIAQAKIARAGIARPGTNHRRAIEALLHVILSPLGHDRTTEIYEEITRAYDQDMGPGFYKVLFDVLDHSIQSAKRASPQPH
jgi:hypothetical protein